MSTWKRLAERLMRFSGLEAVENPMESEDEMDTTSPGGEVMHALNAQDPHSPSSGPVMRGAKRSAVDVNGRILPFDNSALGNNSKSAAKLSSNSGAGKGIWYKKGDRNALSNSLSYLFENEILTDMVVVVDEKEEIRAHKAILASQSTYLRNLIEEASFKSMNLEEKKNQYFSPESENMNLDDDEEICVIHLKGMSFEVAERIIGFLYSGRIFLTDTNVIDVFLASNMMNISELKQKCEEHVSSFISVDSLQVLLQAARTHNAKELEKRCTSFFQNNAESVLQTESFLEISESILIDLLCKDFYISNELAVFDFVLKWGKTKRRTLALQSKSEGSIPSVQELLINVMKYVRLISIPKSALERKVACSDVVDEELMLEVLFRKLQTGLVYSAGETYDNPAALDSHGKPVKFYLKPRRGTWKKLTDFENESQYSDYMKSVLRQGMLLRAVNSYEQVQQGDVGEFVQFNTGIPPCQVRWQIYGNTYWLFWRDLEIV